jgi:hypothetical protein
MIQNQSTKVSETEERSRNFPLQIWPQTMNQAAFKYWNIYGNAVIKETKIVIIQVGFV